MFSFSSLVLSPSLPLRTYAHLCERRFFFFFLAGVRPGVLESGVGKCVQMDGLQFRLSIVYLYGYIPRPSRFPPLPGLLIRPEEYLLLLRHQQQQQQPKEMCVYTGPAMVREEMTIWQGSGSVNISQTRGV
jgi:hypothetical protein